VRGRELTLHVASSADRATADHRVVVVVRLSLDTRRTIALEWRDGSPWRTATRLVAADGSAAIPLVFASAGTYELRVVARDGSALRYSNTDTLIIVSARHH
jgi:hypothetical protein